MSGNVPQISADMVKGILDNKEKVILLDVRTPAEFAREKIEGSINLPLDRVDEISAIAADKNARIIAYCLSGARSDIAVPVIHGMGYANAFSMTHGLLEWRMKKYPLVQ